MTRPIKNFFSKTKEFRAISLRWAKRVAGFQSALKFAAR